MNKRTVLIEDTDLDTFEIREAYDLDELVGAARRVEGLEEENLTLRSDIAQKDEELNRYGKIAQWLAEHPDAEEFIPYHVRQVLLHYAGEGPASNYDHAQFGILPIEKRWQYDLTPPDDDIPF